MLGSTKIFISDLNNGTNHSFHHCCSTFILISVDYEFFSMKQNIFCNSNSNEWSRLHKLIVAFGVFDIDRCGGLSRFILSVVTDVTLMLDLHTSLKATFRCVFASVRVQCTRIRYIHDKSLDMKMPKKIARFIEQKIEYKAMFEQVSFLSRINREIFNKSLQKKFTTWHFCPNKGRIVARKIRFAAQLWWLQPPQAPRALRLCSYFIIQIFENYKFYFVTFCY